MSDDERVIVISGGSRGLGSALVKDWLARGAHVATCSRSSTPFIEECQQLYGEAQGDCGQRFYWQSVDITYGEAVRKFVSTVARRFGRIDALINNAGISHDGVLPLMRPAEIHQLISINFEAAVHFAQACAKVMMTKRQGVMVNISSVNAIRGHKGISVYSATKAALDGLTRSLARELGSRGIRVNSVAPGFFESEMTASMAAQRREQIIRRTPLGRFGAQQDIVDVIGFLLSPQSGFMSGQTIVVDGGLTC